MKRREWIDRELIAAIRGPATRRDAELRSILVGLLVAHLAAAGIVGVIGHGGFVMLIGAWVVITAVGVVLGIRFGRDFAKGSYSEGGFFLFFITLGVFQGWNWIVFFVVSLTRAPSNPRVAWTVIEVIAVIPLLATITFISRRLRTIEV